MLGSLVFFGGGWFLWCAAGCFYGMCGFSCLLLRFGEDLGLIFEKMWYNGNYWRLIVMQLVRWGWRVLFAVVSGLIFPGSSMVEQEAVNFEVAGSSPAPGAMVLMDLEWFEMALWGAVFCCEKG